MHPNYPPRILQKPYIHQDKDKIDNNETYDKGMSALFIDSIRDFGEVIDTGENANGNDCEDFESQDERITIEDNIDDDDEEDA